MCFKRFNSLFRRLKSNPDLLKKYDEVMQEQLKLGIIVPVNREAACSSTRIHYLPHYSVVRQDKSTTKVRVVYNASAKVAGPSLKVLSAEFYFHKPITVHLELYLFYCFIHFLLYIGQY